MGKPAFDLASAQQAARVGQLDRWVDHYLRSGRWANLALADGLQRARRWWRGPLKLPLTAVVRCCGPEPEMEYRIDPADWERRIATMANSLQKLSTLPPLIVEYRAGVLSIRDGNHRHAAMLRKGWSEAWVVIWYNRKQDFIDHNQALRDLLR